MGPERERLMCDHSAGHLPDNRFPVREGGGNQDQGNQREFQGFRTKLHKPPEKKESCGGRAVSPSTHTHIRSRNDAQPQSKIQ